MKVLERVVEGLIRQRVEIDDMQCDFMSGSGTTDVIFIVRQLQEKHLAAKGVPNALGLLGLLMKEVSAVKVGNENLEVVPVFCYLGDMVAAGGGFDHTLQMCMAQILPIASPSHQAPSVPSDQR